MSRIEKYIRIFEMETETLIPQDPSLPGSGMVKWFREAQEYLDFRAHFLTKSPIKGIDLYVIYEEFGGHCGGIYENTVFDYTRNAFRVTGDVYFEHTHNTQTFLEDYLEDALVNEVYLLHEFKLINDAYADKNYELHKELYQEDLDKRIREYLLSNGLTGNHLLERLQE